MQANVSTTNTTTILSSQPSSSPTLQPLTLQSEKSILKYFNRNQTFTNWDILQLLQRYHYINNYNNNTHSLFNNLTEFYINQQSQHQIIRSGAGNGHNLDPTFANIAAFCFILIITVSVFCNLTLIYIIFRSRSLHDIMHVLIVNLAISDLITSAGTMPFDVDFMLRKKFDHGLVACGVMHFTFLISLPSSVLNLVLLTTERFVSVVLPFYRIQYLNRRNVIIVLTVTWLYTCLVALFPLVYQEGSVKVTLGRCIITYPISYDIFQIVANFSIPIVYICFVNIVLFCVSNKHATNIRSLSIVSAADSSDLQSSGSGDHVKNENRDNTRNLIKRRSTVRRNSIRTITTNKKAAKRLSLLVGVFLFCWLTYIILVATNLSCGICHPRELTWIGNIINYSSSAVNPLLYGLLNAKIRRELKKPFKQLLYKISNNCSSKKDQNSNFLLITLPAASARKVTLASECPPELNEKAEL